MNYSNENRFVIADDELGFGIIVLLTDVSYWADNYEKLDTWCNENSSRMIGMTVLLNSRYDLLNFVLRWS